MPLPFEAESTDILRARYPKALEKLWVVPDDVSFEPDSMPDRPGLHRENVFDFTSGLRLLISRDKLGDTPIRVHVSASWEDGISPELEPKSLTEFSVVVKMAYEYLGGKGTLTFIGISPNMIPHWLVMETN